MLIALLTDFGTRDHFVASMKGTILSIDAHTTIVDITHEIGPQDVRSAAFTLGVCYRDFPPGTIFVAVVDPGVGSKRRAIAASSDGYYFVGPDNGVLSFVLGDDAKVVELTNRDYFSERISSTFHGRDIFGPIAAHLSKGVWLEEFGPAISDPLLFQFPKPQTYANGDLNAEIIFIDHFGNLITNVSRGDAPDDFRVEIADQRINRLCGSFAEAEPNELITIFGSTGFLEIAANRGSAEASLAARLGDKLTLTPKRLRR